MTTRPATPYTASQPPAHRHHLAAWLSVASGLAGLLSFACLIIYLRTAALQLDDVATLPPNARLLLTTDFIAAALQALLLLPLARLLYNPGSRPIHAPGHSPQASRTAWHIALGGLVLVTIARLLPIVFPAVSDILFMLPTGLVGLWLLLICWPPRQQLSRPLAWLGVVAALCLIGVTLNFLLTGGLAVFTQGPFAYATNVPFHIGLALTGTPAFILFPLWSILYGRHLIKRQP